jgi:glycosyltransferase involved in cell wall biosynthesis
MKTAKAVHMTSVHSALDARIFHKECRSLASAGYDVTVIGPHSADIIEDHVRVKSIYRERSRLARMTRTVWRVYREARKQEAEIYHFHDPELIPVGLLLRASGKDVIYDIHEDVPKDILSKPYLPIWTRSMIAWAAGKVENSVAKYFSALVTVTPAIADRFLPLNRRTIVIFNYPYQTEILMAQQPQPWNLRRQSVAYVGSITTQRAIREMVSAMSLLPETLSATLELAGWEDPEDLCRDKLHGHPGWARVRHYGLLDQPSTFRLLHEVRAGLVLFHPEPNHLESIPQKIFEYMGAGLPVIASDFPLWRRILGDAKCGIFVDPLDPREIAGAIEYVLNRPAEAEEMGRRGQAAMRQRYNWDTEAEKLVNLYAGLTERSCAA